MHVKNSMVNIMLCVNLVVEQSKLSTGVAPMCHVY